MRSTNASTLIDRVEKYLGMCRYPKIVTVANRPPFNSRLFCQNQFAPQFLKTKIREKN